MCFCLSSFFPDFGSFGDFVLGVVEEAAGLLMLYSKLGGRSYRYYPRSEFNANGDIVM